MSAIATELDQQTADTLIRMATAMAWLDGAPAEPEKRLIRRLAERLGASPEARRRLVEWLERQPPEVDLDLRSLDRELRRRFLRVATAVADADTNRHPDELRGLRWLTRMIEAAEREENQRQLSCSRLPGRLEETERLTAHARERVEAADATADEVERAARELERACSHPYAHRAAWWADEVDRPLHALQRAVAEHVKGLLEAEGLYDELEKANPQWKKRREALEAQWDEVEHEIEQLLEQVERVRRGEESVAREVREGVGRVLARLRDALTQEKEGIYAAFYRESGDAAGRSEKETEG